MQRPYEQCTTSSAIKRVELEQIYYWARQSEQQNWKFVYKARLLQLMSFIYQQFD